MSGLRLITLQQAKNQDDLYIVDRLINCIEPQVGSVLSTQEARLLIARSNTKVTINKARP